MGIPSYEADILERALDNQIAICAFANGSAGAAGVGRPLRPRKTKSFGSLNANGAEAQARELEERTKRLVDDKLAWIEATLDVVPLRGKVR
jgi:hypothetical protein